MATTTEQYYYIRAWGKMMRSFPYFIKDEVERARASNAPPTAIYRNYKEGKLTGEWSIFEEIEDEGTKVLIAGYVEELKRKGV